MANPVDDIAKQARQGSVAAIIQTLNEQLAVGGVRTRAIFADGVLQLLCEAAQSEQLEKDRLVKQIRQILETISPRNIRRVKINSRIVREQQLLWLEEIHRDPENQLLWSEEITLARPNLFKQMAEEIKLRQATPTKEPDFPKVTPLSSRQKRSDWRGVIKGAGLTLLVLLFGWITYEWAGSKLKSNVSNQAANSLPPSPSPKAVTRTLDSFAEAVRLAEQASALGKAAQTPAQWLDLAVKWQQASDLMSVVKSNDPRYKTAQDRVSLYRQYSEAAQQKAKVSR